MMHPRATRRADSRTLRDRRGAALAAVLWLVAALAAMLAAVALEADGALTAAEQRLALLRAGWRAEECAERARAVIDAVLMEEAVGARLGSAWATLDESGVATTVRAAVGGCDVTLAPAGTAVDVNAIDAQGLDRLLAAAGVPSMAADSMRDALLDWRDADDEPHPLGAERDWYAAAGRPSPRNAPLADRAELDRVRGFEGSDGSELAAVRAALDVAPAPLVLERAEPAALATLPGFSPEVVALVVDVRRSWRPFESPVGGGASPLQSLLGDPRLSPEARASLAAAGVMLQVSLASEPAWWTLVVRASAPRDGGVESSATHTLTLVRAGRRAAVMRRSAAP